MCVSELDRARCAVCWKSVEERWGEERAGYLMKTVCSDLALAGPLMLTDVFERSVSNKQDCLDACEKLLTLKWTNPLPRPVRAEYSEVSQHTVLLELNS